MHAREHQAVVMGGSAGALDALGAILTGLPVGFALPIAVVLHVPPSRPNALVDVVQARTALRVREVEDKEPIAPSTVYLAPPNYHLLVEKTCSFALSVDPPVCFSRPSVDVLFESAADALGPALIGVLLTGANEDGARGLLRIHERGGTTIVQAPETALVATMPEAALRLLRPDYVLDLSAIGGLLARLGTVRTPRAKQG